MMSKIEVDLDILNNTKIEIDNFLKYEKDETDKANTIVEDMGQYYKGDDYNAFKESWNDITNDSSIYYRTQTALQSMSSYLNKCYTEYTTMQSDLKNIATGING